MTIARRVLSPLSCACFLLLYVSRCQGFYGDFGLPSHSRGFAPLRRTARAAPRCPEYQAMTLSDWTPSSHGLGEVQLFAATPGAAASQRRTWLSDDGATLRIRAARPVHLLGGRGCLPRNARLSSDGRYEILEGVVALPRGGDVDGARVRHEEDGVRITMPLAARRQREIDAERLLLQQQQQQHQRQRAAAAGRSVRGAQADRGSTTPGRGSSTSVKPVAAGPTPEEWALAQGVEIVSEEYPWPEKHPNAAEGWYDNRGEFHEY